MVCDEDRVVHGRVVQHPRYRYQSRVYCRCPLPNAASRPWPVKEHSTGQMGTEEGREPTYTHTVELLDAAMAATDSLSIPTVAKFIQLERWKTCSQTLILVHTLGHVLPADSTMEQQTRSDTNDHQP